MRGVKAKRLRREDGPKADPVYNKPFMMTIKGKEVYIPRRQRRALVRKFLTDLRKGRINLNDRPQ